VREASAAQGDWLVQLKDNAIVITQFDRRRLEGLMAAMRDCAVSRTA
jgi:hypothetical protein